MADIQEFRTASLVLDSKNLVFVVEAKIIEKWDSISIPMYRDSPVKRSLPTFRQITAIIRRRYQKNSSLHSAMNGSSATLEFDSSGDSIQFSNARVIQWEVCGELGGEMMEEIVLSIENED
jgi:hypothetical protein